ncbi:Sulfatase-like protein, partial [Globisporangium splendens]
MVQLSAALARARTLVASYAYWMAWSSALYMPLFAYPLYSRWLSILRNSELLGVSNIVKGSFFGFVQDLAICFQTLLIVRVALALHDRVRASFATTTNGQYLLVAMTEAQNEEHATNSTKMMGLLMKVLRGCARVVVVLTLVFAFLWATLAVFIDFGLLVTFHPRLNRGFVEMYFMFADQFMASVVNPEVLTPSIIVGLVSYILSLAWWTYGFAADKIALPEFDILFCFKGHHSSTRRTSTGSDTTNRSRAAVPPLPGAPAQRKREKVADVKSRAGSPMAWVFNAFTSLNFRYVFLTITVYVSALQATIALDGDGNDIYLMSNAMFSLQMENYLRPPDSAHTMLMPLSTNQHTEFLVSTIGTNEVFSIEGNDTLAAYPFWRKTLGYMGKKRFNIVPTAASKKKYNGKFKPDIIFINMESWRAHDIGCIGGAELKAKFNQTPSPFFDEFSKSGILFKSHYTPSIQTSRTLMSSLFGVMPSFTDGSAVRDIKKLKLRIQGIQNLLRDMLGYVTGFWSAVSFKWEDWDGFFKDHGIDFRVDQDSLLQYLTEEQKAKLTDDDRFSWGRHDPISFAALENYLEARAKQPDRKPMFLDVYSITSHDPWVVPSKFVSDNVSALLTEHNERYLKAMNMADRALGKLITNLRSKGLLENTIVIIEGDHGYGRMEHGDNPDVISSFVYEVATHIPLLILADDFIPDSQKGTQVTDVTSQTDILATIADMISLEGFTQHGIGHSAMRKESGRRVVLENPYHRGTKGVRVGDLKYAFYGSGAFEVFNVAKDPGEYSPIEKGTDPEHMSNETRANFEYATKLIDTSMYLYKSNAFMPESAHGSSSLTQQPEKERRP